MSKQEEKNGKFFDKKNYNTIILGSEKTENKKSKKTNVIDLLTNESNKELKEDVLKTLKQKGGDIILIDAINDAKKNAQKQVLVAAFWEANIDCKEHIDFFVELALNESYEVSLEALTVIEESTGPFDEQSITDGIIKCDKWLKDNMENEKNVLIESLKNFLNSFKTEDK